MHREALSDGIAPSNIVGIGTATTDDSYTQEDLLDFFQVSDRRIRSLFLNSAIGKRYLTLPPMGADGTRRVETQGELLEKHKVVGIRLAARALEKCLGRAGARPADMRYLCCVSTTGLLSPGFSALLCNELGIPWDCGRLDVVGMGCNAGLNGLNAVASWARVNPGELAVLLCIEVCSAAYVFDATMRTAVVNSLFGDGAAGLALRAGAAAGRNVPAILKFNSFLIPHTLDAMRFDWDEAHGKFSFFLDRNIPYVIGAHAEQVIASLLNGTNLRRRDIAHWIIHSGGKKVIDSVKINLGLSNDDVRHTSGVLHDYGNLSSSSFLFSLERLLDDGRVKAGDYGVLMTMGPGSTIETALVQWPDAAGSDRAARRDTDA